VNQAQAQPQSLRLDAAGYGASEATTKKLELVDSLFSAG
jgi:hypothetical protein